MQRRLQLHLWYVVVAVLAVVLLRDLWVSAQRVEEITYSEFEQALREGRVATVEITHVEAKQSAGRSLRDVQKSPIQRGDDAMTAR